MRDRRLLILLGLVSLGTIVLALLLGPTPLSPVRVLSALAGQAPGGDVIVVQSIRLPRATAAFLTGGALALSGAGLQGLLRNPLAEPGVLGVSAGASFAATLTIAFGLASFGYLVVPAAALAGALAATALIAAAAIRTRSMVTLILIGVALSSFIGALMSLVLSLAPNPIVQTELLNWSFGSVANRSWLDIALAGPPMLAGAALLFTERRGFTALTLGEETARTLGVDLRRQRIVTVLATGLLTGASVALAGAIGFVGIVAPHIVRPLTGHDPGRSLAPSFLLGGIILTAADICVRLLPTASELKLGILAALVGAPAFAIIAARRQRGRP